MIGRDKGDHENEIRPNNNFSSGQKSLQNKVQLMHWESRVKLYKARHKNTSKREALSKKRLNR
jgi:hypothetical protein